MEKLIKSDVFNWRYHSKLFNIIVFIILILSATGIIQPDLTTTVNGKETLQSPETAQKHSFVCTVFICYFFSFRFIRYFRYEKLFVNNKMSGILHIIEQ